MTRPIAQGTPAFTGPRVATVAQDEAPWLVATVYSPAAESNELVSAEPGRPGPG